MQTNLETSPNRRNYKKQSYDHSQKRTKSTTKRIKTDYCQRRLSL